MGLPSPFENVDDRGLAEACTRGDEDAFAALERRFGRVIRAVGLRVLDDAHAPYDVTLVTERVDAYLRRNQFGPLRTWSGNRLVVFLSLVTREAFGARALDQATQAEGATGPSSGALVDDLLGSGFREDTLDESPSGLDRLSPYVNVMLRLRLHGLGATGIAAALGTTRPAVVHQLGLIASHLGRGDEASTQAFRLVLGHATHSERVALVLRSERDRSFRQSRHAALETWDAFRDRALASRPCPSRLCLSIDALASLVDGSLRGPSRAEAEGHVGSCAHCAQRLASSVTDQDVVTPLRDSLRLPEPVAQLATAVSTLRPELALSLADEALLADPRRARALVRIAKTLSQANRLARLGSTRPSWGKSEGESTIPTDDEAPIVALEALVSHAPSVALRAVDEHLARRTVGLRIRLLAAASMGELARVRALARDIMERSSPDPELARDVDVVMAVPDDAALPIEVLAERVRTLVPDVVRYVVDLGR